MSILRKIHLQFRIWSRSTHCCLIKQPEIEDFEVCNEPVLKFDVGSPEMKKLEAKLKEIAGKTEEVPIVIGGKEIKEGKAKFQVMPHNISKKVAKYYHATDKQIEEAIKVATKAQVKWDNVPIGERIKIWLKAADLMSNKYRYDLLATTMLGQSKTVQQAEIDAACELIDFTRFNAMWLKDIYRYQPDNPSLKTHRNAVRYRGMEGFTTAISPFNFTAIAGNLAYTPVLMGNAVLWKPSDSAILSNWLIFKIMKEAGVPDGVVNFIPSDGPTFGNITTLNPLLNGINFTGSLLTFEKLWRLAGRNLGHYINFPRLVGECGGKNFHFIHPSADLDIAVVQTILSAYEYSGQKCSACSRLYVPKSLWGNFQKMMVDTIKTLKVGDPANFDNFTSAVINKESYKKICCYMDDMKCSGKNKVIVGGNMKGEPGYFVDLTMVEVKDPKDELMKEEIFGPILAVYAYDDAKIDETINIVGTTTKYALTGAIFAENEDWIASSLNKFRMCAGNLYINDKCTGAVVGQQPFGGSRKSGTNDKAGGPYYILKWTTPQTLKQTFMPTFSVRYPHMG